MRNVSFLGFGAPNVRDLTVGNIFISDGIVFLYIDVVSLQHGKSQYLCIRSKLKICTEKTPTTFSAARRRFTSGFHYSDVITSGKASQTASRLFSRPFVQAYTKENIKVPHYWPLSGESTGGRCIPLTNGQWRGKCFHLMTSSFLPEASFGLPGIVVACVCVCVSITCLSAR